MNLLIFIKYINVKICFIFPNPRINEGDPNGKYEDFFGKIRHKKGY